MVVTQLTMTQNSDEELKIVFFRFDKNKDDLLDYTDLFKVFEELKIEVDEEECKDIVYCIDEDKDLKLDFSEFVRAMMYDVEDLSVINTLEKASLANQVPNPENKH